jgi:hypothetical protein
MKEVASFLEVGFGETGASACHRLGLFSPQLLGLRYLKRK